MVLEAVRQHGWPQFRNRRHRAKLMPMKWLLAIMLLTVPSTAHAHGGGLDGLGCHHNRKLGGYHCHRGKLAGQSFSSKQDALGILSGTSVESSVHAGDFYGKPRIIDGDTIELAGQRIRLHGIDAPEAKQICTREGQEYACGQEAIWALARIVEEHGVTCQQKDTDRYGRIVAVCYMAEGQIDINALLVEQGWALAYRRYSMDYVDEENTAEASRAGMWAGEFMKPWEWRKK